MSRIATVPREILYFAGIGSYGFVIGIVYWFLTYEAAGAILLTVFGAASVGFALLLAFSARGRPRDASGNPAPPRAGAEGSFGSPPGRIPGSSLAPLEVGFGIAVCSLSFAFGIWMLIGGIVPFLAGAYSWIRNAERELIASRLDDPADHPSE
jgi:cytochrome c oxidase subunit IV